MQFSTERWSVMGIRMRPEQVLPGRSLGPFHLGKKMDSVCLSISHRVPWLTPLCCWVATKQLSRHNLRMKTTHSNLLQSELPEHAITLATKRRLLPRNEHAVLPPPHTQACSSPIPLTSQHPCFNWPSRRAWMPCGQQQAGGKTS